MNKPAKFIITPIIVFCLLFNSITVSASWGVDESGKYSLDKVVVIVDEKYSQNPEDIIKHIQSNYPTEEIQILSESTDNSPKQSLMLLVKLPTMSENDFKRTIEALCEDQYMEYVLKDYYYAAPLESYLGDVNQDGYITTEDARKVLKYAANQEEIKTETEKYLADVDRDGIITTYDAIYVLKVCSGIDPNS